MNGTITGTGYFNKELGGSLTFNAPQYLATNSYISIGGGTVTLNGGNNTLYEGIGGISKPVPRYRSRSDPRPQRHGPNDQSVDRRTNGQDGNGGTVTSSAPGGTLVLNNNDPETFGGQLTGSLFLAIGGAELGYYQNLHQQ